VGWKFPIGSDQFLYNLKHGVSMTYLF